MSRRYRFDDVEVDLQSFRVLKGGKPLALEPKALNLLIFLVENRGRLVGRRELITPAMQHRGTGCGVE
jgi:DNA-binding winged helix-turn-helix (wHTH) protein